MKQCWFSDERLRPSFEDLVLQVGEVITNMEHHHNEKVSRNITYINVPDYGTPQKVDSSAYKAPKSIDQSSKGACAVQLEDIPDEDSGGYLSPKTPLL